MKGTGFRVQEEIEASKYFAFLNAEPFAPGTLNPDP
jgi:hypothetical protein